MPIYMSNSGHRTAAWMTTTTASTQRVRCSSGSSCSTLGGSACTDSTATTATDDGRRRAHRGHRRRGRGRRRGRRGRRCQCCCHYMCNELFSSIAPMFSSNAGIGLSSKSDASSTLLVWLLLILQFLVKCIRFFSIQYELTNEAEENNLYAFLTKCWRLPEDQMTTTKRTTTKKDNDHRISKGYFTATTRSEIGSSTELLSPPPPPLSAVVTVDSVGDDQLLEEIKLKRRSILTVPSTYQLSPLYTSREGEQRLPVAETNYITCIFEATGSKLLEVVDDIRKELSFWRRMDDNLITICCEMSWSIAADERHIPSETNIQQTVYEHMQINQRRVDDATMELYNGNDGYLKTLPSQPVVQQHCVGKNGATSGCYRRLYPSLLPLVHAETADVHQPYWALEATADPPPPIHSRGRVSVFQLNLICIVLNRDERR